MAACELVQTVIGCNMGVRIAQDDVGIANIGCFYGKADNRPYSWRHPAFFHAAQGRVKLFITDDPLVPQELAVYNQIGEPSGVGLATGALRTLRIERKRRYQKQTEQKQFHYSHGKTSLKGKLAVGALY